MDNFITRTPVNSTARRVVRGGNSDGELNREQLRENLVAKMKSLTKQIQAMPKGAARKEKCRELTATNEKIHAIRPAKKAPGVQQYFINAAREFLTKTQFDMIMGLAVEKLREVEASKCDD